MARFLNKKTALILCASLLTLTACAGGQDKGDGALPPPSEESWQLLPPTSEKLNDRINYPKPAYQAVPSSIEMSKRLRALEEEVADIKARMGMAAIALGEEGVKPAPMHHAPQPVAAHKPMAKPTPVSVPAKAKAAPSKNVTGQAVLNGLRFINDKGVTQAIIDTGVEASYTTDLDNTEKLLVVELKGIKAGSVKSGKGKGLISSYSVQPTNDGARIIYQLNGSSRIVKMGKMMPAGSYGHRILLSLSQ
ncbi:MAG: FimV family protein [Pseudobdellovibrionaceae bacterium]